MAEFSAVELALLHESVCARIRQQRGDGPLATAKREHLTELAQRLADMLSKAESERLSGLAR